MMYGKKIIGIFIGAVTATIISLFYLSGLFQNLQYITSDFLRINFTKKIKKSDIVYILITDATLIEADEVDGIQWPWPRQAYGEAIKFLNSAGANQIIFDILFSETSLYGPEDDETLAETIKAGNVTLPYLSTNKKGNASAEKIKHIDNLMLPLSLNVEINNFKGAIKEIKYFRPPVDVLLKAAENSGDAKFSADSDGVGRRVSLLFKHNEKYYPSLSLAAAIKILNTKKIVLTGHKIVLTGAHVQKEIPIDNEGMTWLKYYGDSSIYNKYLLLRVIKSQAKTDEGEAPYYDFDLFKNKTIIIASDATELKDLRPNPFNKIDDPGAHYQGTAIDNILKGEFIKNFYDPEFVIPFLFLFSIAASMITAISNAYMGFLFTFLLVLFKVAMSVYLFYFHDMLTESSVTFLTIIAAFSLTSIVNYIMESQKRAFVLGAFGQYLSPKVVKQLVENPAKLQLGGERRIMTAFFSDIAGFSGISEKLEPEELVTLLNEYLSEMCTIIGKHQGTIDKFEGDAIIAFWGAPIEAEEHAILACRACLEMQEKLILMREKWKKEGKHELFVRMGLNSGPMIVGNMGSKTRMDYTIMGDSVNLASRLEGVNKFYGTNMMISEFTWKLVKDEFEARELDIVIVVGKKEPVKIYELLALKGKLNEQIKKGLELFKKAIYLYRNKEFEQARDVLNLTLKNLLEDPPSKIYIKRCNDYIVNKPDEQWDGVYQLTSKG